MAGSGGEAAIPSDERSAEFLGERNVGCIVGGQVVTELPDTWQKYEVWIPDDSKVGQVLNSDVGPLIGDCSLSCETPQYLRDFKIQ